MSSYLEEREEEIHLEIMELELERDYHEDEIYGIDNLLSELKKELSGIRIKVEDSENE